MFTVGYVGRGQWNYQQFADRRDADLFFDRQVDLAREHYVGLAVAESHTIPAGKLRQVELTASPHSQTITMWEG